MAATQLTPRRSPNPHSPGLSTLPQGSRINSHTARVREYARLDGTLPTIETCEPGDAVATVDEFRERLRRLIDMLGYSQRDIADTCGVSQQSISRWKSGASSPPLERVSELMPVFERLENEARARWGTRTETDSELRDFLQGSGLDGLTTLYPVSPQRTVWNRAYQLLIDDLAGRVRLMRTEIPLGHGISTVVRSVVEKIRQAYSGVVTVPISMERIVAQVANQDETEVYSTLLQSLYGTPDPEVGALWRSALEQPGQAIHAIIKQDIERELARDWWRRELRTRYEQIIAQLGQSGDGWKSALANTEDLMQVILVLDLSPSPGGRRYVGSTDELSTDYPTIVDDILQGVGNASTGLPRVSFIVVSPQGSTPNLSPLEVAVESRQWNALDSPPRLDRSDLLDILACHANTDRLGLDRIIDPRFTLDLNTRGITSAYFELKKKINLALAATEDNAGVLREADASVSNTLTQQRPWTLEQRFDDLDPRRLSLK